MFCSSFVQHGMFIWSCSNQGLMVIWSIHSFQSYCQFSCVFWGLVLCFKSYRKRLHTRLSLMAYLFRHQPISTHTDQALIMAWLFGEPVELSVQSFIYGDITSHCFFYYSQRPCLVYYDPLFHCQSAPSGTLLRNITNNAHTVCVLFKGNVNRSCYS